MRKPLTPAQHPLDPLVSVMAKLRGPGGCPWDREQDHHTLKKYLIEEAYEVLDAIDQGDDEGPGRRARRRPLASGLPQSNRKRDGPV